MSRPAITPRLATLDPLQIAVDVCTGLLTQIGHMSTGLSPFAARVDAEQPLVLADGSRVGQAVQRLVRFAQGQAVEGDPIAEVEHLLGVDANTVDISTPLGVSFAAASGRRKLADEEPVTVRELACLGGTDPNSLRRLVRSGDIKATGRGDTLAFTPTEARVWLESRWLREK